MKLHLTIAMLCMATPLAGFLPSTYFSLVNNFQSSDAMIISHAHACISDTRTEFGSMIDFVLSQGAPHIYTWPSDVTAIEIIKDRYVYETLYNYLQHIRDYLKILRSSRAQLDGRIAYYHAKLNLWYEESCALASLEETHRILSDLENDLQASCDYIAQHASNMHEEISYFTAIENRYCVALQWLKQVKRVSEKSYAQYKLSHLITTDHTHVSHRTPFIQYMKMVQHDITWLNNYLSSSISSTAYAQAIKLRDELNRLIEFIRNCKQYAQEYYS